jgi:D-beta-D-heptose 7-phosphate kinase/D-beta-D-heptose 1-phosphate adenosyltransferase
MKSDTRRLGKTARNPRSKILSRAAARERAEQWRAAGCSVVFTNGCFDLLHAGHVEYLNRARAEGGALIVGLNSDASVRANKGPDRPLVPQDQRALIVAALECVDAVVVFDEPEPAALIEEVGPDVLVKGADWAHYVSGREAVERRGGRVVLAPLVEGLSTSALLCRIRGAAPRGDKE